MLERFNISYLEKHSIYRNFREGTIIWYISKHKDQIALNETTVRKHIRGN